MDDVVFHVSDQPDIVQFDPRPAPNPDAAQTGTMVWAVDRRHLVNYLLPRDCPRVTFAAAAASDPRDVERLLVGGASRVVAIESGWLDRIRDERIYRYDLPGATFELIDEAAGYSISREAVVPQAVTPILDILAALLAEDVELRVLPSLWSLRDAVVDSTLEFSLIRMRNARPRDS